MDLLLLLFIFALFALPMFLVSRANRKRLEQAQQLQVSIKPGDKVITVSGFHGEVVGGTEETVDLELAPGTVVTMERAGVMKRVEDPVAAGTEAAPSQAEQAGTEPATRVDDLDTRPDARNFHPENRPDERP